MKSFVAFLIGVCFGVAGLAIVKANPPTDCGCKDCSKETKCKPRCLCAHPNR